MTTIPLDTTTTTDNCRYCLMCRHVCPVGHVTALETLTPHGWGLTIASVKRGLITWNETTITNLYSCADCGGCRSHCVNDQPLPDAIAAARMEVAEKGDAPAAVYEIQKKLETWGNPYQEEAPEEPDGAGHDAIFVGDEAPYLWPDGLDAALELLRALEITPVELGAGRSSGYVASSLGLAEAAGSLADKTLEELRSAGIRRLFVFSAGDYYTFKQLYGERLGRAWPDDVDLVEITGFLYDQLQVEKLNFKPVRDEVSYAYVDPSHGVRVPGRAGAPRALLREIFRTEPKELFWRADRGHPVGSTALQFTQPHVADMLTRDRLLDARKSGAQLLICEDPGTLAQLGRFADQFGLETRGLYEILAEQLVL
ncbi:MAG: (Fe-S)-binding protein [Anaerolineales bacterium]|nr:(Fe-S)-binding protein [Anaerolineales bacterium]